MADCFQIWKWVNRTYAALCYPRSQSHLSRRRSKKATCWKSKAFREISIIGLCNSQIWCRFVDSTLRNMSYNFALEKSWKNAWKSANCVGFVEPSITGPCIADCDKIWCLCALACPTGPRNNNNNNIIIIIIIKWH